jgi:hypothetical protein
VGVTENEDSRNASRGGRCLNSIKVSSYGQDNLSYMDALREEEDEIQGVKTVEEYLFIKTQVKHTSFLEQYQKFEQKHQKMLIKQE